MVEFFAGEGRVWSAVRAENHQAMGIDLLYGSGFERNNPFDILTDSGLACKPQRPSFVDISNQSRSLAFYAFCFSLNKDVHPLDPLVP